MDKLLELFNGVDWKNVGVMVIFILGNIVSVIVWLRKNIVDLKQLNSDAKATDNAITYSKASIRSNKETQDQLTNLAKEVRTLGTIVNKLSIQLEKKESVKDNEI